MYFLGWGVRVCLRVSGDGGEEERMMNGVWTNESKVHGKLGMPSYLIACCRHLSSDFTTKFSEHRDGFNDATQRCYEKDQSRLSLQLSQATSVHSLYDLSSIMNVRRLRNADYRTKTMRPRIR